MAAPKCTTQALEFHKHLARDLPLDRLNQMANARKYAAAQTPIYAHDHEKYGP